VIKAAVIRPDLSGARSSGAPLCPPLNCRLDDPIFRWELLVVAGFFAGYGTTTRNSYATGFRLFAD